MSSIIFSFIFVLLLSSMAFSDITTAITSLAARNAEGYLAPFGTMMGTSMNSGFYRKASPHKILGFDITLDLAYGLAPPGETSYNFIIPDDSIGYSFPFQIPKSYLQTLGDNALLGNIPDYQSEDDTSPLQYNDKGLFQDLQLQFNLPLNMLMQVDDTKPAQNILGDSTTIPLEFDFGVAGAELFTQIVDGTWLIAKEIDGVGKPYEVKDKTTGFLITTIPAAFDSATFRDDFAANEDIMGTLESALEEMNISLPIPGGFGHYFPANYTGIPLPIFQISVGLPFHTELTARGLPVAVTLPNFGSMKYGGFGGKIGISDYLSDILYKTEEEESPPSQTENIKYVMNIQPSEVNAMDVDKAISDLKLQGIDTQEIDSLNYLLVQGDTTAVVEIQNRIRDAQLQLESMPKSKKKKKKFPIDLSLGYYSNDLILDLEGQMPLKINSTNQMITLQVGKNFNMPFIAWLGGIGLYGGLGFESSNLSMDYTFVNPISFNDETSEDININLDFPGDNKFRKLIGARMRLLFLDAYVDWNMGSTSNAINVGVGITIR